MRDIFDDSNINEGVVCDVTNCQYHDQSHHCTASQIVVGPSYANCCGDTLCATFIDKNAK